MNLVGISLPILGWLCGDEHMEPWIIALLPHATTADLQGSQGGSHVIVPKTYNEQPTTLLRGGCIARKTLTRVSSHPTS